MGRDHIGGSVERNGNGPKDDKLPGDIGRLGQELRGEGEKNAPVFGFSTSTIMPRQYARPTPTISTPIGSTIVASVHVLTQARSDRRLRRA